jgi:hypothetical protein
MKKLICLAAIFTLFICAPCIGQQDTGSPSENTVLITGTIKHFSGEGGFYVIESDDGQTYKPERLSSSFQREGLRVKAHARILDKKLLFRGWTVPIDIIDIERVR